MRYPKILIIGACGQLGREFAEVFTRKTADLGKIPETFENAVITLADKDELDVTDCGQVFRYLSNGFDFVINCSAYTAVDKAEEDSKACYDVNFSAVKYLAEACRKFGSTLVHFSTDYVYGGDKTDPYTERDECVPLNVYGKSKLDGEKAIASVLSKYFIFRTSWLYGKYGNNFVYKMIGLQNQRLVKVVRDQIGTPTYANDLVYNVLQVLLTENYGVYNCSGKGQCSRYEFAKEIFALINSDAEVVPVTSGEYKTSAKRPCYSVMENAKLQSLKLDFMRDWKTALESFIGNVLYQNKGRK